MDLERGSVSIFLIILFAAIFLFHAVLIDYTRILLAKKQTEQAVQAAVRSVMSAFDLSLYDQYGLFGIPKEGKEAIFSDILHKNLATTNGYFHLVQPRLEEDSFTLDFQYALANHQVIKQQIMDEMKYKGPINLTIDLIKPFQSISGLMKKASYMTNLLHDIKNVYEQRSGFLQTALMKQRESSTLIKQREYPPFDDVEKIVRDYKNYVEHIRELKKLKKNQEENQEAINKLEDEIDAYKKKVRKLTRDLIDDYQKIETAHHLKLSAALDALKHAKEANKKIKAAIEKAKKEKQPMSVTDGNPTNYTFETMLDQIDQHEDMVIPEVFFQQMEKEILEQQQMYQNLLEEVKDFGESMNAALSVTEHQSSSDKTNELEKKLDKINKWYHSYQSNYIGVNNKIEKRKKELADMQQELNKDLKKAAENQSEVSLERIKQWFTILEAMKQKKEAFSQLEADYHHYLQINDVNHQIKETEFDSDPEDAVKNGMKMSESMFANMLQIMEGLQEEVYINEYVFERFRSFDPTQLKKLGNIRGLTKNKEKDFDPDYLLDTLSIESQEVEYILYGFHYSGGNIAAALTEVFMFRLAINTMEGFIETAKKVKHPIAILVGAVLYGITKSIDDLRELINGNAIPISKKYLNIPLTYKDHLRIFLLIHHHEKNKLSRIQALIHYHLHTDLQDIATFVKGTGKASIKLLFLPSVFKGLNKTGLLEGKTVGNDYLITKTAVFHY